MLAFGNSLYIYEACSPGRLHCVLTVLELARQPCDFSLVFSYNFFCLIFLVSRAEHRPYLA